MAAVSEAAVTAAAVVAAWGVAPEVAMVGAAAAVEAMVEAVMVVATAVAMLEVATVVAEVETAVAEVETAEGLLAIRASLCCCGGCRWPSALPDCREAPGLAARPVHRRLPSTTKNRARGSGLRRRRLANVRRSKSPSARRRELSIQDRCFCCRDRLAAPAEAAVEKAIGRHHLQSR